MKSKNDKNQILFWLVAAATFLTALFYECLTPVFSDDLSYMGFVAKARNIGDVVLQEVEQYLAWTGRSVAHLALRFYLYFFGLHRGLFNVIAAVFFVILAILIVRLVRTASETQRMSDRWQELLLTALLLWLCSVKPGQTIFWMTGAYNYLFTTTLILGFFALERRDLQSAAGAGREKTGSGPVILRAVVLALVGILAGWCNENTSGAAVLYTLILLVLPLLPEKCRGFFSESAYAVKEKTANRVALIYRITAFAAVSAGFVMQLLSPGNRRRSAAIEESHTGLLLLFARFLKIAKSVETLFLPLLLAALFLFILALRQGVKFADRRMQNAILFLVLFAATAGCLILAPDPQSRTYFGAGIFLIIACMQLFICVDMKDALMKTCRDFALAALVLVFLFQYVENAGNLARIQREENTRYALLTEAAGQETAYIPMLPEPFDNRYTMAYEADVTERWYDFPNMQCAEYFGEDFVVGVPFEEYGEETE